MSKIKSSSSWLIRILKLLKCQTTNPSSQQAFLEPVQHTCTDESEKKKEEEQITSPHDVFLIDDTLLHIISYLDNNSLLQARLVCNKWNNSILSVSGKKLGLILCPQGRESSSMKKFDTKFFTSLMINLREDIKCLEFLQFSGKFSFVRKLAFVLTRESSLSHDFHIVKPFAFAANQGLLRYLEDLVIIMKNHTTREVPKESGKLAFYFDVLPGLKRLRIDVWTEDQAYIDFFQDLVNAATNLCCLESNQILDLGKLRKLNSLSILLDEIECQNLPLNRPTPQQLSLNTLRDKILNLKLILNGVLPELPVFPFVRNLTLCFAKKYGYRDLYKFSNNYPWREVFPALENLKLECSCSGADSVLLQCLKVLPPLTRLDINLCNFYSWDFKNYAQATILPSSVQILRLTDFNIVHSTANCQGKSWLGFLLNLPLKHFILELESHVPFSLLVEEFAEVKMGFGRLGSAQGLIEFHNGSRHSDEKGSMGVLETIHTFPVVAERLKRNWNRMLFKYFQVRDVWERDLKEKLKVKQLSSAVEFFF